jgi:apolipoprotein N-acyltransferase
MRMVSTVTSEMSFRRRLWLVGLSAVLCVLAFPRMYWWGCAWFGFIPLFFSLEGVSKARAFLLGYVFGVVFWTGTVSWLMHVTVAGQIILILYLSFYPAFFCAISSRWKLSSSSEALWCVPAVWVLLEYVRSHALTGFGWALLGYSQTPALAMIQIADIAGAYGVSFMVLLVNMLFYQAIGIFARKDHAPSSALKSVNLALGLAMVAATIVYGWVSLRRDFSRVTPSSRVVVIQPNIPQELKWYAPARQFIIDTYVRMNRQAAAAGTDLIIWPEAALPGVLGVDQEMAREYHAVLARTGVPVLFGAVRLEQDRYYNSALLSGKDGIIETRYDKMHLVPFGEYVPLKKFLPWLEAVVPIGDMTAGSEYVCFPNGGLVFAALICFEDVFPEISREFVRRGADVLVNMTNDAWYMYSSAAEQHFQASIFRAVENRRYLVRSANTGVSGFVNPQGRVLEAVRTQRGDLIFGQGQAQCVVHAPEVKETFYTRYGDVFVLLCCGVIGLGACAEWFRRRGEKRFYAA